MIAPPFVYALVAIFIYFLVKFLLVRWQAEDNKLTKWFGRYDFWIQAIIVSVLFLYMVYLIIIAVLIDEGNFTHIRWLSIAGLVYMIVGVAVALWSLKLTGLKHALGYRFFSSEKKVVRESLYTYFKNPMYTGIASAMLGFAVWQNSWYGIILAVEYSILMKVLAIKENEGLYE